MRRVFSLALLACALAPGCAPSLPVAAQSAACADIAWGGYDESPECAALARRTIRGSDRACRSDADCALVHPGASCREQSVAASRVDAYRALPAACTHPAGGPCNPARTVCRAGCCTTTQ